MTAFEGRIFLLGECGAVEWWDPFAGTSSALKLEDQPGQAFEVAVTKGRFAILCDQRRTIRVYDLSGKLLRYHNYVGETQFTSIALTPDAVAASTFYDDHLLLLFRPESKAPIRLIANPRYWPDSSPRYSSFVGVHADGGKFFAFDLVDFTLYVVDPAHGAVVDATSKEPHPWSRPYSKPSKSWDPTGDAYTGTQLAVSSTVANAHLYVLMLDRTLVRGKCKPGDGFLELSANTFAAKGWETLARLKEPERFGGSAWLSIIGNTAFLLKPGGVVYAVPLPGR